MAIRLVVLFALVSIFATVAEAQSSSRRAAPQAFGSATRAPAPQSFGSATRAPQQFGSSSQSFAPNAGSGTRSGAPGSSTRGGAGLPAAQTYDPQTYNSLLGTGLPSNQKEGCNCFQLPEVDFAREEYDPYASKNYWNLCPPTGAAPRSIALPQLNFNSFIPRPSQSLFRR